MSHRYNQFGRGGRGGNHHHHHHNRGYRGGGRGGGRDSRGYGGSYHHSHHDTVSGGNEICRYFIEGKCTSKPCRFPHVIKKIGETRGHTSTIKDLILWTAQQQLFTCSNDSTIKLWNCADWSEITTISVLPASASSSSSSSTNNRTSSGSSSSKRKDKSSDSDNTPLKNPDGSTPAGVSCMVLEGPWLFVGFEQCLSDSPVLPSHVPVGLVRGWNLENPSTTPYEFYVSPQMPYSHSRTTMALEVAVDATSGAATLFSASQDGSIRYWQFDASVNTFQCKGQMLETHARGVTQLRKFTSSNNGMTYLISSSMDSTLKIWDLTTYRCVHTLGHIEPPLSLSSSGLHNAAKGMMPGEKDNTSSSSSSRAVQRHSGPVMDMVVWTNANEQYLISGGMDKKVMVWNLVAPFDAIYCEEEQREITCLCGSSDAQQVPLLLIGLAEGSIVVKELPSFSYKTTLSGVANVGHRDTVRRLIPGPANTFFSAGNDKLMIAWQWTDAIATIKSVSK